MSQWLFRLLEALCILLASLAVYAGRWEVGTYFILLAIYLRGLK